MGARQRGGAVDPQPGEDREEPVVAHDRVEIPADGFEIERMVFIELEKKATERAKAVAKLNERARAQAQVPSGRPVGVPVPAQIIQEAILQGARGQELEIWIAATVVFAAVGFAFGASSARLIPGIIRAVKGEFSRGRGVSRAFPRSGPALFNANERILALTNRKLRSGGGFAPGHDFSGTEG